MAAAADGKPGQEPSMEEILSSIRRIIAEDEGADAAAGEASAGAGRAAPAEDSEVLELTEIVPEGPPLPAARAAATPPRPPAGPAAAPTGGASGAVPFPAPRREPPAAGPGTAAELISAETAKASAAALARLARAGAPEERRAPPTASATLEQFLGDLLAPMLREWLDRNLPEIVERVVEQEVKKLARRAELM